METTTVSVAGELATRASDAWARYLLNERGSAPIPHDHVYASAYRVCERRMVLELRGEPQPPFTAEVLAKFKRGSDRERELLIDLTRAGRLAQPEFQIIGQQERFQLRDHKGRVAITGKVDARLLSNGTSAPLEVKAWSPFLVDQIETFADLFDSPWTRSGAYQLLAYLYGAGQPYGFLLLDRSGLPRLIPVELERHLDQMEDFLARAERVLDHYAAGTLPDFLDDPTECQRCPFYGSTCNPPLSAVGATILTDPDLEVLLEKREKLKSAAHDFDAYDKEVKQRLRGVLRGIVGSFHVRGKWGNQSRVELPADLKAKYTRTDPKGRFTLDIVKL